MKSSPEKVMGHTEGKLSQDRYGNIKTESDDDFRLNGATLSSKDVAMANTRRLVACWNALDGLPQDALDGGWTAAGLSLYAHKLEVERDELVKALRSARDYLDEQYPMVDASELLDEEIDPILSRYPENK